MRRADRMNGLEKEEHQMFWERKEKTGDIKDEDKIYINGEQETEGVTTSMWTYTIFQIWPSIWTLHTF